VASLDAAVEIRRPQRRRPDKNARKITTATAQTREIDERLLGLYPGLISHPARTDAKPRPAV
jgi:hypothetical protein